MGTLNTGIRRRARLLGEALRPPRRGSRPVAGGVRAVAGAGDGRRPPKRTEAVEATVPRAPRLVERPVFVLAPVRSGSTLLRMLLNSHSGIRAPHELHLRSLGVDLMPGFSERSMRALELDKAELEHMLWDRVLHFELERSGKAVVVDKTPGNVWSWQRLRYAWPGARFLILHRHPQGIISSLNDRKDNTATPEENERNVLKYLTPLEKARRTLDGPTSHTVRYEDLVADPAKVTRGICDWLDLAWEPDMLRYGDREQGPLLPNLGDRSEKILSGRIQPGRRHGGVEGLRSAKTRAIAEAWGY
ncbi:hypothetical protein OK074_7697 [Actinobacteria bacterium OK074]|nr:hypothetical protein OK074_7697 [Actinobacteria bacterium OK074]